MIRIHSAIRACDHIEKRPGGQKATKHGWGAPLLGERPNVNCSMIKTGLILQLALLALFLVFLPGTKLQAQTGTINGTVVDPSGAVIPGAKIQIINAATGNLTRDTISDSTGTFRLLSVPAATYNIKVSATGMEQLLQNRSEEHTSELQSLRHLVCRL